jgi:Tfp pilus assembly protein PilF
MVSFRASIRDLVPATAIAACLTLPACGHATPAQSKAESMTPDTKTKGADRAAAGQSALEAGDYAKANAEFDAALAAIGGSAVDTASLDDTGMQLTMAKASEKQGDLAAAAKLKGQVVRARLAKAAGK